jgi:homoserine kinase
MNAASLTKLTEITVHVPATSANLGPGFDSVGLALMLANSFTVKRLPEDSASSGVRYSEHPESFYPLGLAEMTPQQASSHLMTQTFQALWAYCHRDQSTPPPLPALQVETLTRIPPGRGLGSSATAIVAALLAGNHLLAQDHLSMQELINLANAIEGHPDNTTPALVGGVCLCDELPGEAMPQVRLSHLHWPADHWGLLALVPHANLTDTKASRKLLPDTYSKHDVIFTLRKAAQLALAIERHDTGLMRLALQDVVHQPYRLPELPFWPSLQALVANIPGVMGMVLSGSGPTLLVVYERTDHDALKDAVTRWVADHPSDAITPLWTEVAATGAWVE